MLLIIQQQQQKVPSSKEKEKEDDNDSDDYMVARCASWSKRVAKKKPLQKKKPALTMCCARDLCKIQEDQAVKDSEGHPCIVYKELMHGNICSDGKVDNPVLRI